MSSDSSHPHSSHSHSAHAHSAPIYQDHEEHLGHEVEDSLFRKIFGVLLILTILTVAVAGAFENASVAFIVAFTIATMKAALVVMFFMHLKYEKSTILIYAFFPILLLIVLIGLVFLDAPLRDKPQPIGLQSINSMATSSTAEPVS